MTDKTAAVEILRQLGGNRFIAMTGAKNFCCTENCLGFKIGRNEKGVNWVLITLMPDDLYKLEFRQVRMGEIKLVSEVNGIYNDQLEEVFTEHTGLYTRL